MQIAVIGAGAAGFFAAIRCASLNKNCNVTIFEKGKHVLSKVRVSGGGRCNVTHSCFDPVQLTSFYPRGYKELKSCFSRFNATHTVEWFESKDVKLKTENDGRMFPVTDSSETIINCLVKEATQLGINIRTQSGINSIHISDGKFLLNNNRNFTFDKVLVSSGGAPNLNGYDWLRQLGHTIIAPVPSLFTFNIPESPLKGLEGISLPNAGIKITGTSADDSGPLLITHWGVSGPVVLRLSAWQARKLFDLKYQFEVVINWIGLKNETDVFEIINSERKIASVKKVHNKTLFELPNRLWMRLCELSGIGEKDNFADLSKQKINKLVTNLISMKLKAKGKTTFKEEFVTCGGIDLKEVDLKTMESKIVKTLFFAGEILNIDGITGGFNFQNAWTTGWIAGTAMAEIERE